MDYFEHNDDYIEYCIGYKRLRGAYSKKSKQQE